MKVRALLFLCICFSLYVFGQKDISCLLYTSPSPRDA